MYALERRLRRLSLKRRTEPRAVVKWARGSAPRRRLRCAPRSWRLVLTIGLAGVAVAQERPPTSRPPPTRTTGRPEKPAAAAAKGKPVTLSGTMICAKCSLSESDECQNVLKVTKAGKEEKYYLAANDVAEKNHEQVCSGEHKATVKGTVSEEEGKKVLTASSIKYK